MQLYIVRHGPACGRDEWTGSDEARPLTTRGEGVVLGVARRLAELGVSVDPVVTSPYARALRTAELVARELASTELLKIDARLSPGFSIADLRGLLADYPGSSSIMIVGHEPDLGQIIGELVGVERLKMRKGSVALVDLPDPRSARGQLQWFAPPKVLEPDGGKHDSAAGLVT